MWYEIFFVQGDEYLAFSQEYKNPDENLCFWDRVRDDYMSVLEPIPMEKKQDECPNDEYWELKLENGDVLQYQVNDDIGYCALTLIKKQ